jgi:predicted ATPase
MENFRGFEDHTVDFPSRTLLVGPNNAGKSTIVEALRLVSLVANRPGLTSVETPNWLGEAAAAPFGVSPSLKGMDFELDPGVFHQFGEPPARLTASFTGGGKIELFVGADSSVFAVLRTRDGSPIGSSAQRRQAGVTRIGVQPHVGPVQRREEVRDQKYVEGALDSSLAPLHFRNQLLWLSQYWDDFSDNAESTWPRLQVSRPEIATDKNGRFVLMLTRDGAFAGDLASMGHGLQMWLQMIWFLARNRTTGTIVLDEPDVYMHADLQRKLIRFVGGENATQQLIIATHSVEMMAEAKPSEVVVVDAKRKHSRPAKEMAAIQKVIGDLGGVHALQYSRLWSAKRCLLLEGKDMAILKPLHDLQFPRADALDVSPSFAVGGWGGWHSATGIAGFVKHGDAEVMVYAVFDSDYFWPAQIDQRKAEAHEKDIQVQIWRAKEIENYLLIPAVIQRVIAMRCTNPPTVADVEQTLEEVAESLKARIVDGFSDSEPTKGWSASTKRKAAEEHIAPSWGTLAGKLARVPGKDALSGLAAWSKDNFDVSFGRGTIVAAMSQADLPAEVQSFLAAVEGCTLLGTAPNSTEASRG